MGEMLWQKGGSRWVRDDPRVLRLFHKTCSDRAWKILGKDEAFFTCCELEVIHVLCNNCSLSDIKIKVFSQCISSLKVNITLSVGAIMYDVKLYRHVRKIVSRGQGSSDYLKPLHIWKNSVSIRGQYDLGAVCS